MTFIEVRRSGVTYALRWVAAVILIVGAADVLWYHVVSSPPTIDANGLFTSRGAVERRADVLWGGGMLLVGLGLMGWTLVSMARSRPLVRVDEEGLRLLIGGPRNPPTSVPWDQITYVRSTSDSDATGTVRALAVTVANPGLLPREPWGARWVDSTLIMDATGWNVPAEEVAIMAQVEMDRRRRDHASADEEE